MKLRNKETGEIKSIEEIIRDAFLSNELDSLKNIDANWEDVDGTNDTNTPLIKDEKIRKVFRKWAGLYGAERFRVEHFRYAETTSIKSTDLIAEPLIELPGHIGEDSEIYTIEELCGEEEE